MPINSTLFNAQNAGNSISELLDFIFFWWGMPPHPPGEKGPYSPFSGHSCLLHLHWPLVLSSSVSSGASSVPEPASSPSADNVTAFWPLGAITAPSAYAETN